MPPFVSGACNENIRGGRIPEQPDLLADLIPFPISVYDLDDDPVTFSIRSVTPFTTLFDINSTTGDITVNQMFDRETHSEYTIVIDVSDGMFEGTLNINVIIRDVNDNRPTPEKSKYSISVVENIPINTSLLTVVFNDPDVGDNAVVLFSLTILTAHNYPTAPFVVSGTDSNTAHLLTAVEFDFEAFSNTQFNLEILGSDLGGLASTAAVIVTILDDNDNVPSVNITNQTVYYPEEADNISLPVTIVMDPDTFPILCANVILEDASSPSEILYIDDSAIPNGFVTSFMNNILYIAGSGTPEDYSRILSNIKYSNQEEEFYGSSLTRTVTILVADRSDETTGSGSGFHFKNISSSVDVYGSGSLLIVLVPLNDPPEITCAPVSLDPIDEDDVQSSGQTVRSLFAELISDNDNDDVGIALIQSPMDSYGQLEKQVDVITGFTPLLNASITSAYLLGPDDLLRFVPASHVYGNFSFEFLAWDGTGSFTSLDDVDTTAFSDGHEPFSSTSCTADIVVSPVNDPPVIELGGIGILNISRVYVEGQDVITSIDVAPNASVSDVDTDHYLERLIVNISSLEYGCAGASDSLDVFYCVNISSIPITNSAERHGPSCISYTFVGRHTITEWQTVIQSCKFRIDDLEPSGHTRLLEYTVYDSMDASDPAYATITVELQNDNCPDLSINGARSSTDTYVEHSGRVVITGTSLQLTDLDGGMIESAQVTITPAGVCSDCVLRVDTSVSNMGITQDFRQNILNIRGPASIADFEAVLQTLEFEDHANEPDTASVNIVITVSDGNDNICPSVSPPNTITINLMIIVVHDQAAYFYPNGGNETTFVTVYVEGGNPVPIVGIHATFMDDDFMPDPSQSTSYTMTITLQVGCGVSYLIIPTTTASNVLSPYDPLNCSVTFSSSPNNLETDLMQIRFSSDSRNPDPSLQLVRFDLQDFNFTTYSVTEVNIIPVNDAPVVDLNVTNSSYPNTNIIYDISAGMTSVTLVGSMGSSITDIDDDTIESLAFTLQEFSDTSNMIPRTDGNGESVEPPSNLTAYGLSSSGFNQATSRLVINGPGSLSDFTAALDAVVYQNLQPNPTTNIRRVVIVADDGNLTSVPVRATILFAGENHPPIIENVPVRNVVYFANDPAIVIAPDILINEPDDDLICTASISGDCDVDLFDFSDIMYPDLISFDNDNGTLVLHTTPYSCLLSTTFSSILRSIKYFSSTEGVCTMTIQVTEQRGLVSNVESIVIETRIRNKPPRVDLDLGAPGAAFATQYLQGVTPVHIVSIFNATLNSTISSQFFEGEAIEEVGEAPATNESAVPTIALSHAGYLLEDDDDVDLIYLRATIVNSSTSIDDVLVFPCVNPLSTDNSIETTRGCDNRQRSRVIEGRLRYNPNITSDCSRDVDICSGLRVEITCPYTGYKRYTFSYTNDNSSIVRFRTLLGCIGYEYLVEVGGYLNHERCIDVTTYDGDDVSNVATAKVQLLESNRLFFDPLKENISICEGEKPSEKCIYFVARPKLLTGQLADPATVKFAIISGNNDTGNKFAINENGGVYLVNSLDRETQDNYTLLIRAFNLVGDAVLTLCISVEDVNDNHPIIPQSFKAEVPEGIANAFVIQLNATDKDEGSNAELMYFIVGYGSDKFTINSDGVIRTSMPLVTGDMYVLVVIVTDRGDIIRHRNDTYKYTDNDNGGLYLSSHTIVTVDVTTRFLPTIKITPRNSTNIIPEDQSLMTVVQSFMAVNNETLLSDNIQYVIVSIEPNNPREAFAIKDTPPGQADLITNTTLDAEMVTMYSISIMALNTTTNQVNPGNAFSTVFVTDVNDNIPQFINLPDTIALFEDTPSNTTVLAFMVSDNDISRTSFTFDLSDSFPIDLSGSVTFAIGSTEQIRREQSLTNVSILLLSVPLDFESQQSGYLNITVYDDGRLSNSASVYITIMDVNDNKPVPLSDPISARVIETAPNNTVVFNISNVFTDSDTVGTFMFSPATFESVPFCIDGQLLVVCQPDILTAFEQNDSYTFDFNITNPPLDPVNVNVKIYVELVNEFAPMFTRDVFYFSVQENSAVGVTVGSVSAYDSDGGNHGIIDYIADIPTLPFVIDSEMGNITTTGEPIDYENITSYSFQVNATDNPFLDGGVQFTDVTMVYISVIDLNDNPPEFLDDPYDITVEEHPGNGYVLIQFTVTDQDSHSAGIIDISLPASVPFLQLECNYSYECNLLVNDSDALDYDTGPRYIEFNITANDTPYISTDETHVVTATVRINVTNINDLPPVINGPSQLSVNEVSGDGNGTIDFISVGQVDASDGDMNELTYNVLGPDCTEDVPFTVNSTAGEIYLCIHIDYEVRINYSLTVEVFDGRFSTNHTIPVEVIDRNDNPPVFSEPLEFIVSENFSTGMFIGAIAHSDRDSFINSMVSYTGLNVPEVFNLSSSGRLYINNASLLDLELYPSSYTFYVLADNPPYDSTDETQLVNITITVNVSDINEHPPVVSQPCLFSVEENAPFGYTIGTIDVVDPDPSATLYYVFIREGENRERRECTTSFPFRIGSNTGVVDICNATDYERIGPYIRLIVNVTDGINTVIGECTVIFIDVNDVPPVISPANETLSISELAAPDTMLLEFSITDGDSSSIHHTITSAGIVPSSAPFYLLSNDTDLRLFLNDTLDYETMPSYSLLIIVNNEQLQGTAVVEVNVINANDLYPQFNRFSFNISIFENVTNSYELLTVMAIDPDMASGPITYDVDPPSVTFAMDNDTLVVADQTDIDYDSGIRVYSFNITATDSPVRPNGVQLTSYLQGEVHVLDVNDNAPVFDNDSLTFTVREDKTDRVCGTVRAVDDDSGRNAEVTYSITLPVECSDSGNGSGSGSGSGMNMDIGFCSVCFPFTIDSDTGDLMKCGPLDFEIRKSYSFQVVAVDMGSPPMSGVGTVLILVEDVNDNSPQINNRLSLQNFSLLENVSSHAEFINATDADSGENSRLVYETQISGTNINCTAELPFTANENGYLILCQTLDYETVRYYTFDIVVYDSGIPVLNDTVSVTVTVINVNDNEPVIESSATAAIIEEQAGIFVIDVEASDADAPQFPIVSYQLIDPSLNFAINETTGEIWIRNSIDREVQEYIIITVIVYDQDFYVSQDINVTIIDINDNDPRVLSDLRVSITENVETIIPIEATDPDAGNNSVLIFSLVNASNNLSLYSINPVTGNLTVQPLDRDPSTGGRPQVIIDISVSDFGLPPRSVNFTLTIDVIDVNDNAPLFSGETVIELCDGTPIYTIVYNVTATDYDEGSNANLTYSVVDGTAPLDFIPGTPELKVIRVPMLNQSDQLMTLLTIQIQDWNVNPSNRSNTLVNLTVIIQSCGPRFPENVVCEVEENTNGTICYAQALVINMIELLNYTISKELPFGNFAISSNGSISAPSCCLDYEDAENYSLVIEAADFNDMSLSDTTRVDIVLTNVNEHPPILVTGDLNGTVDEDAENCTEVVKALAIDLDFGAAGDISYVVNDSSIFAFDDATGYLKVVDPNALDHENQSEYVLQYYAVDHGDPAKYSETGYITISVTNVDDVPPEFTMDTYRAVINETVIVGFHVLTVSATDIDTAPQDLTYSLYPPQEDFAVDSSLGIIMTVSSLDHETKPVYEFSVVVTDSQGLSDTSRVSIILLDNNDNRPLIRPTESYITIREVDRYASFPQNLSIENADNTAKFPVVSVTASLRSTDNLSFPLGGGFCDHANYSHLYGSSTAKLCGSGADNLVDFAAPLDLAEPGILNLDSHNASDIDLIVIANRQVQLDELQPGFCLCMWINIPARFKSVNTGQQLFRFNPRQGELSPLRLLIRSNIFEVGVQNMVGNENFTPLIEVPLNDDAYPDFIDGTWHHLCINYNGTFMTMNVDGELVGSNDNVMIPTFSEASALLGEFLSGFVSHLHFQPGEMCTPDVLMCFLTCGEWLDVDNNTAYEDVAFDLNYHQRSVVITYTGDDNANSTVQLDKALRSIKYYSILEEPHPLDRLVTLKASDMVGSGDPSFVIFKPELINDQVPILDVNGLSDDSSLYRTTYIEDSAGIQIVSPDTVLYDRDSGYWRVLEIKVNITEDMSNNIHGILEVVDTLQVPLQAVMVSPTYVVINATDGNAQFPELFLDALTKVHYRNPEDEPSPITTQIEFSVNDGIHTSPEVNTVVTIQPANDPPIIDLNVIDMYTVNNTNTFSEEYGQVTVIPNGISPSISDIDGNMLSGAVITIVNRPDGMQEFLNIDIVQSSSITAQEYNPNTGELRLSGIATFSSYLALLSAVRYHNTVPGSPNTAVRLISFVVTDGSDSTIDSIPAYIFMSIQLFNDAPFIYLDGNSGDNFNFTYVEDSDCTILFPNAIVFDLDGTIPIYSRVTLSGEYSRNETINITVPNDEVMIAISLSDQDHILIANTGGDVSLQAIEEVYRNIYYCNTDDEPENVMPRTLTITLRERETDIAETRTVMATINIMRVNDRPSIAITRQDEAAIRNESAPIIDVDSFRIDDSDDMAFDEMIIYIVNPVNSPSQEIIDFEDIRLPADTFIEGPNITGPYPGVPIFCRVSRSGCRL